MRELDAAGALDPVLLIGLPLALLLAAGFWIARLRRRLGALAQQARATEARLARLQTVIDAHCMVNVTDPNGVVTEVNERFLAVTGLCRAEVLGRRLADVGPIRITPLRSQEIIATARAGMVWSGTAEWQRPDGGTYVTATSIVPLMDAQGRLAETVAIRTDITGQRRSSTELGLRATLDLWQEEVWMFAPDETLQAIFLNAPARQRLGGRFAPGEGHSIEAACDPMELPQLRQSVRRLLQGRPQALSYAVRGEDGHMMEVTLQLVHPTGLPPRVLAVRRDVTEREAASRAKAEFVAMVSHELRTPLTSIKGGLALLARTLGTGAPARSLGLLEIAQRNTDRLIVIINDILDLEKIDAGKLEMQLERTDLSALLAEAIEANAGFGSQFGVRFCGIGLEAAAPVEASAPRLLQVLANLMSNAAKFSQPGGVVEVGLVDRGSHVRVYVKDHGSGIPLEAQPRILERFAQADSSDRRSAGGTGLGLPIVKAILEQHGAEIRFHSVPGAGAEFFFDLPRLRGEVTAVPVPAEDGAAALQTLQAPARGGLPHALPGLPLPGAQPVADRQA